MLAYDLNLQTAQKTNNFVARIGRVHEHMQYSRASKW